MSQQDMLGPILRVLVTVRKSRLGKILDLINKLAGPDNKEWFAELVRFLRKEPCWIPNTIDLGAPPLLPYDGAEVVSHNKIEINGKGTVKVELRSNDNLYIDGEKVTLCPLECQMGDKTISGHELYEELENRGLVLLNCNVLDFIFDHPEFFPEHWKKNEKGEMREICFLGSKFRRPSDGCLCVRYLFWYLGSLSRDYDWFDSDWDRQNLSVATVG